MSGIEFNTDHIREDFRRFVEQIKSTHRKNVENRGITRQKKEEMKRIRQNINKSRIEMSQSVRQSMDEETKEIVREMDESRGRIPDLEMRIQDIDREIRDINDKVRMTSGRERDLLFRRIEELRAEKNESEENLNRELKTISENMRAFSEKVNSVYGEIEWNHQLIINDMHDTADAIMSRIIPKVMYDPYCDYAYTAAAMKVEAILEDAKVGGYESAMDQFRAVERWLDDADKKTSNGIKSFVTIDGIKRKLESRFGNSRGCIFEYEGTPNSMLIIRIAFIDCITTIKMAPDGEGGIVSSLVNVTPEVNDAKVHDEICRKYCKIISEAAGLVTDYDKQGMTEPRIEEVQKEKGMTPEERMEKTKMMLEQLTRRRK